MDIFIDFAISVKWRFVEKIFRSFPRELIFEVNNLENCSIIDDVTLKFRWKYKKKRVLGAAGISEFSRSKGALKQVLYQQQLFFSETHGEELFLFYSGISNLRLY